MLVRQRQEVQALPRRLTARKLRFFTGPRRAWHEEGPALTIGTIASAMADERELSLQEQLEGIGAQLDWVRGYL